jgi:hypothetical protein
MDEVGRSRRELAIESNAWSYCREARDGKFDYILVVWISAIHADMTG